ncbi:MAG: hypothetical protein ABIA04_14645 [Pseudomonadota bacterium]
MIIKKYKILDVNLKLVSDSNDFLSSFHKDYHLFEVKSFSPAKIHEFKISINDPKSEAKIETKNKTVALEEHPNKPSFSYQYVLKKLFELFENFIIIHAAVIQKDNTTLAIIGHPGIGKTTITMELLKNNFSFLSDDFCPFNIKTKLVHPFPRSLKVIQKGLKKTNAILTKETFDPLKNNLLVSSKPCHLDKLIFLTAKNTKDTSYCFKIKFKKDSSSFISKIKTIYKDIDIKPCDNTNLNFDFSYPRNIGKTKEIKDLINKYENEYWTCFKKERLNPDFKAQPQINSISPIDAALMLIPNLKTDKSSIENLSTSKKAKNLMLFDQLLNITKNSQSFTLQVGKLDLTLDIIQGLV